MINGYRRFSSTLRLALLGQDFVIFIISNMAAVVRAGRFSIWLHIQQDVINLAMCKSSAFSYKFSFS
jgi:hypothetical protein